MIQASRAGLASRVLLLLLLAPSVGTGQTRVSGTGLVSLFDHQVDIGYGAEESTGLLLGAEGAVTLRSRLTLAARAAGGSLSTDAAGAESRDVGEVGIQGSVDLMRWLALRGGATWRTYSTAVARQRWTIVEAAAEARFDFTTDAVRGVVRAGLLPVVSVNGLPRPDVALTAAAGIEYRSGVVTGGLFYGVERYDFPDRGAGRRLEQVSTLTLRFGARRGGDHAAQR